MKKNIGNILIFIGALSTSCPMSKASPLPDTFELVGDLEDVIDTKTFKSGKSSYTMTTSGFSISNDTRSAETDYYFYVHQLFSLNPSKQIKSYELECFPGTPMKAVAGSPNTTVGDVGESKSESINVTANAGFFGPTPTGGVSGGYTVTASHSFNAPAITTTKYFSDESVKWTFDVDPQSPCSHGTFSPSLSWIWQTKKEDVGPANSPTTKEAFTFITNIKSFYADGTSDNFLSYKLNISQPPEPGKASNIKPPLPLPINVHDENFIRTERWPVIGDLLSSVVSYTSEISGFAADWSNSAIVAISLKFKDGTSAELGFTKSNPKRVSIEKMNSKYYETRDVSILSLPTATLRDSGFGYTSLRQIELLTPMSNSLMPVVMGPDGYDHSKSFDFVVHENVFKENKWRGIEISSNPDGFIIGLSFITSIEDKYYY